RRPRRARRRHRPARDRRLRLALHHHDGPGQGAKLGARGRSRGGRRRRRAVRQRFVLALFAAGALLLSAVAAPAFFGLHAPGDFPAAYGLTLAELAVDRRHTANAVSAVMFEFRGLDTLGEELILFAAVTAVSIL